MGSTERAECQPSECVDLGSLADLALSDPSQALRHAAVARNAALEAGDFVAEVVALRAIGVAHRELGDLTAAASALEEALCLAEDLDVEIWARCALSLGAVHIYQGDTEQALAYFDEAAQVTSGIAQAQARFQLGTGFARIGQFNKTLEQYEKALPVIEEHDRRNWAADLLANRGTLYFNIGRYDDALTDLDRSIELYEELGDEAGRAYSLHNRAWVCYLIGDLAEALALYGIADKAFSDLEIPVESLPSKLEVLNAAGLFQECLAQAQRSQAFHGKSNNAFGQIESLAPGAEAALALGAYDVVAAIADRAEQVEGAHAFPAFLERIRSTARRSAMAVGRVGTSDLAAATDAITEMRKLGHVEPFHSAVLTAAAIALELDEGNIADDLLSQVRRSVRRAPLHQQIEWWLLTARTRVLGADPRNPLRAIRAGLGVFERLVTAAGSFEVRVRAGHHAAALADVAADLFVEAGKPMRAVDLIEQVRAGALVMVDESATSSDELRVALQELASAEAAVRQGLQPAISVIAAQEQVASLSRSTNLAALDTEDSRECQVDHDRYDVLTFIERRGNVERLRSHDKTSAHTTCAPLCDIEKLVERQRFLSDQLARRSSLNAAMTEDLLRQHHAASVELNEILLPSELGDRVVINPSRSLESVSWGALPALVDVPFALALSRDIATGKHGRGRSSTDPRHVILGSSELAHVPDEVAQLGAIWASDSVRTFVDPDALDLHHVDGADIAHIAGHFVANGANPLFSAIPLGRSRLHGHDMLAMGQAPRLTILSACASGRSEHVAGANLGFASAVLAAGGHAVVISHTVVEDGHALVAVMRDLHRELAIGQFPADALAAVRSRSTNDTLPVAGAFSVLGAGWTR